MAPISALSLSPEAIPALSPDSEEAIRAPAAGTAMASALSLSPEVDAAIVAGREEAEEEGECSPPKAASALRLSLTAAASYSAPLLAIVKASTSDPALATVETVFGKDAVLATVEATNATARQNAETECGVAAPPNVEACEAGACDQDAKSGDTASSTSPCNLSGLSSYNDPQLAFEGRAISLPVFCLTRQAAVPVLCLASRFARALPVAQGRVAPLHQNQQVPLRQEEKQEQQEVLHQVEKVAPLHQEEQPPLRHQEKQEEEVAPAAAAVAVAVAVVGEEKVGETVEVRGEVAVTLPAAPLASSSLASPSVLEDLLPAARVEVQQAAPSEASMRAAPPCPSVGGVDEQQHHREKSPAAGSVAGSVGERQHLEEKQQREKSLAAGSVVGWGGSPSVYAST
ncbi:hypothetical protein T484DRAFT_1795373, partial [Baffinella frigidus]